MSSKVVFKEPTHPHPYPHTHTNFNAVFVLNLHKNIKNFFGALSLFYLSPLSQVNKSIASNLIELTFKASQISFQVTLKKRFLKSLKQKNYKSVNSDLIFVFLEPQIQPFFPRFPIRLKYSSYVEPKFGGYPQAPNAKNKMS